MAKKWIRFSDIKTTKLKDSDIASGKILFGKGKRKYFWRWK